MLEEDDDLSPDWHPVRFEPEEKDEEENEEEIISVEDLDDVREDETPAVIEEEEKEEKEDESKSVEVLPTYVDSGTLARNSNIAYLVSISRKKSEKSLK